MAEPRGANAAKRVVLATFGSHGDLNPYLAVGRELRARGLQVVIATTEGYRADVEHCGLELAPVRPDLDPDDDEIFRRAVDPWRGAEYLIRDLVVPNLETALEDTDHACTGADLIVSHVLALGAPIVAARKGIPWLSTVLSPMVFFSAYDMPIVPPFTLLAPLRHLSPRVNRLFRRLSALVADRWCRPVYELRQRLGLPRGENPFFGGQHSPEGVLVMFSEVFAARQPDWPEPTTICGFPFLDQDFASAATADDPAGSTKLAPELNALLGRGEPPVVFTLGSAAVRIAPEFFTAALEAAARLARPCVLVAGPAAESLRDSGVPDGVVIVSSVPYHLLFPCSSVLVHSGGIGTTAQALRAGRPQIVIPFSHDQFDNAARVASLGCGRSFRRRSVNGRTLAAVVDEVLAHAPYATSADQVGARIRAERGVAAAADAIVARLDAQSSRPESSRTSAS